MLAAAKFAVEEIHLAGAAGPLIRHAVVHPGAVVILPLLSDGRIVLIRNWRFAIEKHLWELPAGTLEAGEDPDLCAARELEEETGYRAARLRSLGRFYTAPGICTELMHAYLADGLEPVGQKLEADEQITVEPMAPARVRALMESGELCDAKSMICLMGHFAGLEQK